MLTVTRKKGQFVRLKLPSGGYAWVGYLGKNPKGQPRLGIHAPAAVEILREEIIKEGPQSPFDRDQEQPSQDGAGLSGEGTP